MTESSSVQVEVADLETGPALQVLGLPPDQRDVGIDALREVRALVELTLRELLVREEMSESSFRAALPELLVLGLKRQINIEQARACSERSLALVRGDVAPSIEGIIDDS